MRNLLRGVVVRGIGLSYPQWRDETMSSFSPTSAPDPGEHEAGAVPGGGRAADAIVGPDMDVLLLTPKQAAGLLGVRESWLRRRAAERRVPCSFLGKHLRFSRADLDEIIAGARSPTGRSRSAQPRS